MANQQIYGVGRRVCRGQEEMQREGEEEQNNRIEQNPAKQERKRSNM